jgi:DNA-binding beta-propeller fold protein YncE
MKSLLPAIQLLLLFGCGALAGAQSVAFKYSVVNKIPVPGDGGWDCLTVDDSMDRAFVSHANKVQVVDLGTGKLLGTISGTKGAHGIALAPDLEKGFVNDEKDSSVTVFDLRTLVTLGKISVTGRNPDAILYDPSERRIFAFNSGSANATAIDARADTVLATIPLDGQPGSATTNGRGTLYVNVEDQDQIDVLDSKSLKRTQNFSIAPGHGPTGIAMDTASGRLFITCANKKMIVADALEKKVVTTLPIGEHADGVAFDPSQKQAFSANGEGTLTIVQEEGRNDFNVIYTVVTQKGTRTLAVNPKTHHLYLPMAEFDPAPEPTTDKPKPRPTIKPGSFALLDIAPTE